MIVGLLKKFMGVKVRSALSALVLSSRCDGLPEELMPSAAPLPALPILSDATPCLDPVAPSLGSCQPVRPVVHQRRPLRCSPPIMY